MNRFLLFILMAYMVAFSPCMAQKYSVRNTSRRDSIYSNTSPLVVKERIGDAFYRHHVRQVTLTWTGAAFAGLGTLALTQGIKNESTGLKVISGALGLAAIASEVLAIRSYMYKGKLIRLSLNSLKINF